MLDIADLPVDLPLPILALYVTFMLLRTFLQDYNLRQVRRLELEVANQVKVLEAKLDAAERLIEELKGL